MTYPALWTPKHLSSPGGWWRADNVTLTSGKVSTWQDLSGAGLHVTQATGVIRPSPVASVVNGRPVVRHVSGEYLTLGAGAGSGASNTWWCVLKATAQAVGPCVGVGAQNAIEGSGAATLAIVGASSLSTTQSLTGSFRTLVWTFNGASSVIRVNGSQIVSGATGAPGTMTDIWVGSTTLNFFDGDIAEVGFTRQVLSGAPLVRLENYLRRRYATW